MNYRLPKLYVGPVSKNTVDAVIEYANENDTPLGLIPSRRQIDYNGGYVNHWNTPTFTNYVHSKTNLVTLERDHGGPQQGASSDDGVESFMMDNECFDMIHIDPWKLNIPFRDCLKETVYWLCRIDNPHILFEIGTEEAIRKISHDDFIELLSFVYSSIPGKVFNRILYSVIQSGTSLKENIQTGNFDERRLMKDINRCKDYNLHSKEHNGDYLPSELIHKKFKLGLDSINIAPEFGMMETECYINEIKQVDPILLDVLYSLCYKSNMWKKWVDSSFDVNDKERLIKICGHYIFSSDEFDRKVRSNLRILDDDIKSKMKERIHDIITYN